MKYNPKTYKNKSLLDIARSQNINVLKKDEENKDYVEALEQKETLRNNYVQNYMKKNNLTYSQQNLDRASMAFENEYKVNYDNLYNELNKYQQEYAARQPQYSLVDTILDLGINTSKGFLNTVEGVVDTGRMLGADVANFFVGENDLSKWLKERAEQDSTGALFGTNDDLAIQGWTKGIEQRSLSNDLLDSVAQGIGNIGAFVGFGGIGAGLGATSKAAQALTTAGTSFSSSYGNTYTELKRQGVDDSTARKNALVSALAETASEQFFDKIPGLTSAGWGDKLTGRINDAATKFFGSKSGKIVSTILDGMEEGSEEIISNMLQQFGNDVMYMIDDKYTYNKENSLLANGYQLGDITRDVLGQITTEESLQAFLSASISSFLVSSGKVALTTKQRNQIINAYAKDNNMSFNDAKYILTGEETLNQVKQEIKQDKTEYNSNLELEEMAKDRMMNYAQQTNTDYINQRINEMEEDRGEKFSEEEREGLFNAFKNRTETEINSPQRYENFKLEKEPTNEQEKVLYDSFVKNSNNTQQAHDLYDFYSKLRKDNPNANYQLTSNDELVEMGLLEKQGDKYGRTINGKFVEETPNGINVDGKILINRDGLNAFEATTWHEIAHSIKDTSPEGYTQLKNIVKQVYGENDFDNFKQKYENLYGDNQENLEDEYVNDKLGELLNNERFYNRVTENRNLLQRIIDKLKEMVKYISSNTEQKNLMKIQKKLEDKYIELYKKADFTVGSEQAQYSVSNESLKQKQNEIIQKNNPLDETLGNHTWINSAEDIKTYQEALDADEYDNNNLTPDFTSNMVDKALKTGEITVYSSYPIEQGTFVTPSKMEAQSYAGNNKVYSKTVKLNDVAWIDSLQGQYANTNENVKYSISQTQDSQGKELTKEQQEYFKDSKVRDNEGRLLEVYHGTPNPGFTIFDTNKAGQNTSSGEYGLYFTDSKQFADDFSYERLETDSMFYDKKGKKGDVYPVYLNATNVLDFANLTEQQISDLYNYASNLGKIDGKEKFVENMLKWQQIGNHQLMKGNLDLKAIANNSDYDGIKAKLNVQGNENEYIVFNSNQIKNVDNTNPTENEDIRYQLQQEAQQRGYGTYTEDISSNRPERNLPMTDELRQDLEEKYGVLSDEDYKAKKKELFEQYVNKAASKIEEQVKAVAKRNLELKSKDVEDLRKITDKYKELSREDIYSSNAKEELRQFVKDHAHQEYEELLINDETKDLQKDIRSREFIISNDFKGEFADGLTRFKKNNPGIHIKFGEKGNLDTQLQELAEMYPGQISADVSYGDIPYVLADLMKKEYKQTNKQEFNLTDQEIDDITNKMFYGLTNNAINEKQLDKFVTTIQDKIRNKYARQMAIKEYRQEAKDMLNEIGLENIKDKKRGLSYQINTMKRNLRDIMNQKSADKMYDTYFKPISIHNAQIETDINEYNARIEQFNLNDKESTYTQMLGELKYNPATQLTKDFVDDYLQKNKSKIDTEKVNNAIEEFRNVYDELIQRVNESLIANGYKPIDYRQGYFPHFVEDKAKTMLGKFAEKLGFKINKDQLPTDIAGITEDFLPGKAWTSFSQQRTGDATDYNALKGFDNYIRGAMDVIYHTQDIQRLRALEAEIRYEYSDKGVQEKLDEIYNNQDLTNEEKYAQAAAVTDNQKNNPLGNLVTELRNYTNSLANKKSISDRGMEQTLGRDWYSIMSNINGRVSANMVGANISSAMTNFIPITQAWSQLKTKNLLRGVYDTIKASIRDDGFTQNSVYLTNRTQQADRLYKTGLQKTTDVLGKPFEAVDSFTSNVIVRAKYYENIQKGMNEVEAMNNADEFAKDVMAGRSKGDSPTMFNKKNPLTKLFTAFQLEVNNQYGYMFKDIKADIGKEAKDKIAMALMKMFLGAWLYNAVTEQITGRKAAFSPIDMAIDDAKILGNENMDLATKIQNIAKGASQEAPFLGGIMGGGRLPIQGAIPYSDPLSMVLDTGENIGNLFNDEKRDKAIKSLMKEWSKPVYYLALPVAGGQLKKTVEGLSMYGSELPGSYTDTGKLRFEADTSPLGVAQAALFGQYASGEAREYFDKGYAPLTEKQIQEVKDANLPVSEYREIKSELKKQENNNDKIDYIYNLPLNSTQKNILANNTLNRKNDVDISDYGKYGSLEEFDYANKNPEKYNTITQITNYDTYQTYKDDIADIKKEYSNTNERKEAVFDYINNQPLNKEQKIMLYKMAGGYSIKSYEDEMFNYINSLQLSKEEKENIYKELFS